VIWGQIYKQSHDIFLSSYLVESNWRFARRNSFAVRLEYVQKDELFPHFHRSGKIERPPLPVPIFLVRSATAGYTFDFYMRGPFVIGAGANYTWYRFPAILKGFYGDRP